MLVLENVLESEKGVLTVEEGRLKSFDGPSTGTLASLGRRCFLENREQFESAMSAKKQEMAGTAKHCSAQLEPGAGGQRAKSCRPIWRCICANAPRSGRLVVNGDRLMFCEPEYPTVTVGDHEAFMEFALVQAAKSPPASNKFCVGAVLVDEDKGEVLSTGYSLEYLQDYKGDRGTTHAEQCCFIKIADKHDLPEERIHEVLPANTVLYTTMEPCSERLSSNTTCVTRILRLKDAIKTVYVGIREPGTFIANKNGQEMLESNGVKVVYPVEHLQQKIVEVTMNGH